MYKREDVRGMVEEGRGKRKGEIETGGKEAYEKMA